MPSPRAKSAQAEQRAALLHQIAQKRHQQSNTARPAHASTALVVTDSEEEADLHELEDSDFSSPENKPPNSSAALDDSPGIRKPGLSRLKRNANPKMAPPPSADDLVAGMQQLNMTNNRPPSSVRPAPAFLTMASTQLPNPGQAKVLSELAAAAACKLPSDDEDSGNDQPDQPEAISSGTEADSEGEEDGPARAASPPARQPIFSTSSSQQPSGQEEDLKDALVLGDKGEYVLPGRLHTKLYPHQVEGVRWLWSLYLQQRGGILGDDMGLGKTMQCAAFVAGLLTSKLATRVLIVAPKTLLLHWEKELGVCGLGRKTHPFYGDSASERDHALRTTAGSTGGVLLTTYGMVLHNAAKLSAAPVNTYKWSRADAGGDQDFRWDLIILDEGHKVKNPKMKLVQELRRIPAGITVIISGTPIQNNLMELHALFDICCEGLLEDRATFKKVYERHITAGQDRNATPREREVGAAVAAQLRRVIAPFFLRREKKDVLCGPAASTSANTTTTAAAAGSASSSSGVAGGNGTAADGATSSSTTTTTVTTSAPAGLPHKNDLVVWLRLQPLQKQVYTSFLHSDAVKRALNETDSPLAALTVLKKICDHPALLSEAAAEAVIAGGSKWAKQSKSGSKYPHKRSSGYSDDESDDDDDDSGDDEQGVGGAAAGVGSRGGAPGGDGGVGPAPLASVLPALGADVRQQLMGEMQHKEAHASCKTLFVMALLDELSNKGHRTLVFSQSRVMLDILQAAVVSKGMSYCRIDGSISSAEDRQAQVKKFQAPGADIPVFLLTSQVGGLGLTLTAADRVVIVDPAWNPAVDNQAVDRAYRIGQTRDVVVYRLITCGTVEEKIYRKQVFKGGLSRTGTEEGVQFRYFTRQQLRDLFVVTEEGLTSSATQQQLHQMHAAQRVASPDLQRHLQFLYTMSNLAGISDHDLLFSSKPNEQSSLSADQQAALVSHLEEQAVLEGDRPGRRPAGSAGWGYGAAGAGSSSGGGGGASELSAMFNAALRLSGAPALPSSPASLQQKVVAELAQQLDNLKGTISSLAARMHDGGSRLFKRRDALTAQLAAEQQKLQELQGSAGGQPATSTTAAASPAAATAGPEFGVPSPVGPGGSYPVVYNTAMIDLSGSGGGQGASVATTPAPALLQPSAIDLQGSGSRYGNTGETYGTTWGAAVAGRPAVSPAAGLGVSPAGSTSTPVPQLAATAAAGQYGSRYPVTDADRYPVISPSTQHVQHMPTGPAVSQATSTGSRGRGLNLHYGKHKATGAAAAGGGPAQHVTGATSPAASSSFVSAASDGGDGGEAEVVSGVTSSRVGGGATSKQEAVGQVRSGGAAKPVKVIDLTEEDW